MSKTENPFQAARALLNALIDTILARADEEPNLGAGFVCAEAWPSQGDSQGDEFWGHVKKVSDEQRALPRTLRDLSGVARQEFHAEELPASECATPGCANPLLFSRRSKGFTTCTSCGRAGGCEHHDCGETVPDAKNATPPVDGIARPGAQSQRPMIETNVTGNATDCPDETTQDSSRDHWAGEASPQNRTQDLESEVDDFREDIRLMRRRLVTGQGTRQDPMCRLALRHAERMLAIIDQLMTPHQAGSDRTSQGGELTKPCHCNTPIVYPGVGHCMACGGGLRQP